MKNPVKFWDRLAEKFDDGEDRFKEEHEPTITNSHGNKRV